MLTFTYCVIYTFDFNFAGACELGRGMVRWRLSCEMTPLCNLLDDQVKDVMDRQRRAHQTCRTLWKVTILHLSDHRCHPIRPSPYQSSRSTAALQCEPRTKKNARNGDDHGAYSEQSNNRKPVTAAEVRLYLYASAIPSKEFAEYRALIDAMPPTYYSCGVVGTGMFLAAAAKNGTNILEYMGRWVCKEVYDAQNREHVVGADSPTDGQVLDDALDGNIALYVSYHCSPDAMRFKVQIGDKTMVFIRATPAGAEHGEVKIWYGYQSHYTENVLASEFAYKYCFSFIWACYTISYIYLPFYDFSSKNYLSTSKLSFFLHQLLRSDQQRTLAPRIWQQAQRQPSVTSTPSSTVPSTIGTAAITTVM